ncbi:MAG: NAD(P)/FAD-dependent oxidoreductase, partial [Anaerolineales bacterium]|nr:NAD(P)/FAD-dependent oxidoreductase [Anaerolineales bacterium]
GAEAARLLVQDGRAVGVALANGDEIRGRRVISALDPRRTFLGLVDPLELEPDFVRAVQNLKLRGAWAKVNLALAGRPQFRSAPDPAALQGTLVLSPSLPYLERAYDAAKYGQASEQPYLEAVLPTLADPGLAPAGRHILSVHVQFAPYHLKGAGWDDQRAALGERVVQALAEHAPDLPGLILERQVLTPLDLERTFGLTEGSLYHGEMMLDQILFMRPVPGWAQYRTPITNLYLCGPGTHPGGGVSGLPGRNAAREVLKDIRMSR